MSHGFQRVQGALQRWSAKRRSQDRRAVQIDANDWEVGGSLIPDEGELAHGRETFNMMLFILRATDSMSVQWAACVFQD